MQRVASQSSINEMDSIAEAPLKSEVAPAYPMEHLTKGTVLARSVVWNFIGQGSPMLLAVFTVPLLIKELGTDRFGILMLAWMIINYFNLFDLGLGRALTQMIAEKIGKGRSNEISPLSWTSLFLMAMLGLAASVLMMLASPYLVCSLFKIPERLQSETIDSFYLLAVSIPIVTCAAGLRGILEAMQRFDLTSINRIAIGVFTFVAPILVLPFSDSLLLVMVALVVGRIISLILLLFLGRNSISLPTSGFAVQRRMVRPLLRAGGWMTVSNLVTPLMMYLDRFVIGGMISITAVAYYATPFEAVTKLLIIPGALVGVLFPTFSSMFSHDSQRTNDLYHRGIKYVFLVLFPITLLVVGFAKEILHVWLGAEFSENGFRVMQVLVIGVLMNGLANIPFALVQGVGRADLTAKLNFLELPLYLGTVWWLVSTHGIVGAACAWSLRMGIDAMILFMIAHVLLGHPHYNWKIGIIVAVVVGTLAVELFVQPLPIRFVSVAIFLLAYVWVVRTFAIDRQEKLLFSANLRSLVLWDRPRPTVS